ncbi:hypothetical protein M9Q43_05545 [Flavobacterium sp. HXWNR29]|uniref:hypothetical protein n=1 Tax=Flavobacterium odoriferum TaxID=2946604 RepID=UPI0021CB0006|nr:hypothetical protein [Flavobacterium sp. HXWNR29]MCU4188627.1 hypothetical protein [Flavobacterium sp. HXWNR29]
MEDKIDYIGILKDLKNNLNKLMVYYLSEIMLDSPQLSDIKANFEDPSILNQTLLVTKNLDFKGEVTPEDFVELLNKKSLLESNTFYLIELKASLNPESFDFLIDKYMEDLRMFIRNSELLIQNYEVACKVKSNTLNNYLLLQDKLFKEHLQEINNKFFPPIFKWKLPKPTIPIQEPKPRLKDLIIKGNAEAIEKVLMNEFKNTNSVTINRMFTALNSLGYIIEEYGNKKNLIECLNNSIGSEKYISRLVFINKINVYNDKKYIQLRTKISNLLEKL